MTIKAAVVDDTTVETHINSLTNTFGSKVAAEAASTFVSKVVGEVDHACTFDTDRFWWLTLRTVITIDREFKYIDF